MKRAVSSVYDQVAALEAALAGTVCVLGIGNRLRGDDGAGSIFAEMLDNVSDVPSLDGGVAPENYLEKVIRLQPDTVLIVDAADFQGIPGEVRVFPPDGIRAAGLSTHALSLSLACEYLANRTSAKVYLLGIQPESNRLGDELSETVRSTLFDLTDHLVESLCHA